MHNRIVAFCFALLIGSALWLWLYYTRAGMAIRAISVSTEASGLVGIDVPRLSALAFALGGAVTTMGGTLISTFITLDASVGVVFTMKALIIIIMGGVGDIRGAIVAALILGVVETAVASLIDPGLTLAAAYAIFVLILLFRPQGLFWKKYDMIAQDTKQLIWGALLLGLAACVPAIANGYWMSIALTIAMFTVLSTSWALFSGPTHYISLATGAFFGVGGFLVGTGMSDYNMDYWSTVVIASVAGAVLAFFVGLATLRLSGVYFVIFTLGLAEMIRTLVSWIQNNFTGSRGLYVLTDLTEPDIYLFLVAVGGFVYLFGWWVARSRLGFAMRIIGNDETVAKHVGINTAFSKVILFTFTGFIAALVGALIAPRYTYIEPNGVFSPELSFVVVIMALLGGTGRLWGPIVGVIPFALLQEYINANYSNYSTMVLGIAFLIIVYFLPHGVLGRLEQLWAKRRQSSW